MNYRTITILTDTVRNQLITDGLRSFIRREIILDKIDNPEGELNLLKYIIDYILNEKPTIKEEQTISYGLWLLKFVLEYDNFSIFELDDEFSNWMRGASNAIYYFEMQKTICENENAEFCVPKFTQLIAISDGVMDGDSVQGIRYEEPEHMSGWYLTTAKYDGKISSLNVIPLQNLVIKRKDLLQFLALPPDFVFQTFDDYTCEIRRLSSLGTNISGN